MMVLQPIFFICSFTSGDFFLKKLSFVTIVICSFVCHEAGGMEHVFVIRVCEQYYPGMLCILKFTSSVSRNLFCII